jgi:hypothetical protein
MSLTRYLRVGKMKKKIICIFVLTLLITTILPITGTVIAGDEENPEIVDVTGDTDLGFLDIESAWFYENADEPDYLFTALKINDLKEAFNAVFSIRWAYNDVVYVSGLSTYYYKDKEFRSGLRQRATYWQWKNMPECIGVFDQNTDIITWKILKSNIGNPQKGDVLTNTEASAVAGFPLSFIYFFTGKDYRDFAPDDYGDYGQDYIIQY